MLLSNGQNALSRWDLRDLHNVMIVNIDMNLQERLTWQPHFYLYFIQLKYHIDWNAKSCQTSEAASEEHNTTDVSRQNSHLTFPTFSIGCKVDKRQR